MVVGSNLGGLKFNFLFAKKLVWLEYERGRDNPSRRGRKEGFGGCFLRSLEGVRKLRVNSEVWGI